MHNVTNFSELPLAEPVLRAVVDAGYETPTPIQAQAIPALAEGRDLVGVAQTGTGKTAAFTLPILSRLAEDPAPLQAKACRVLVLAPTRELAAQIAESVTKYGRHVRHRCAVVVGGVKPGPQVRAMAKGVDVLVATPGRLLDHVGSGAIRLDKVDTVVLDEADQMLDLGFAPAIKRIMGLVPARRRTVLFSATMPRPIRALAEAFMTDPVEIAVTPPGKTVDKIAQRVVHVDGSGKRGALLDLLAGPGMERAIVFTRTKRGADKVSRFLSEAGLRSGALHGNKSQNQRDRALAAFKSGQAPILVATDIAARGIDVDGVSHVVNFELPNVPDAYVHRIGRTARAGREGIAVSLCEGAERPLLRDIERLIGFAIPAEGEPLPEPASPGKKRGSGGKRNRPGRGPAEGGAKGSRRPGRARRKPHGGGGGAPQRAQA